MGGFHVASAALALATVASIVSPASAIVSGVVTSKDNANVGQCYMGSSTYGGCGYGSSSAYTWCVLDLVCALPRPCSRMLLCTRAGATSRPRRT